VTRHTLHNGQLVTVSTGKLDGSNLTFAGASSAAGQTPSVIFIGRNSLTNVTDNGTTGAAGYGAINLAPGVALTTAGLTVSAATLWLSELPGSSVTFNGDSRISNGSTLTATGYADTGIYNVSGTMTIDGTSAVNMDAVAVTGSGTIHLTGESALLRAGNVGAGETVVLDGGMLSLTDGMKFLGTITDSAPGSSRIGPISSVGVYNALDAVRETFSETTGMLSLFNAHGSEVARLKFAGKGDLYAAPTSGLATNFILITPHPSAAALPVTFTN
jgi:hypothetical protein